MTDDELLSLIRDFGRRCRNRTIRKLLEGNDTCCFTTEQFARGYAKEIMPSKTAPLVYDDFERKLARKHLEIAEMKEVTPDVWTSS